MKKIKVAVLRGGPSGEHDISLKTGKSVLDNLPNKYIPIDVFIDKKGVWHLEGVSMPENKILSNVDVVFNAMHGAYGEDGKVQQILEHLRIPFTGSGALASAIGMNKIISKEIFTQYGIRTPVYKIFKKGENTKKFSEELFRSFPMPVVVKPNTSGSSLGVSIVGKPKEIEKAVVEALKHSDTVLIEEFIKGKEATCGVIENFRGKKIYSLPPVEVKKPSDREFYDYEAKYLLNTTEYVIPGNFTKKESQEIQNMTSDVHKALGLRHYSRSDFIVTPKRGIYTLEVNTLPGLTDHSLIPKSMKAVGCSFPDFLDHLITLALKKQ